MKLLQEETKKKENIHNYLLASESNFVTVEQSYQVIIQCINIYYRFINNRWQGSITILRPNYYHLTIWPSPSQSSSQLHISKFCVSFCSRKFWRQNYNFQICKSFKLLSYYAPSQSEMWNAVCQFINKLHLLTPSPVP